MIDEAEKNSLFWETVTKKVIKAERAVIHPK